MTPRTFLPRRTSHLLTWACFACLALWTFPAAGQQVDQQLWGVDPVVKLTAVAVSGQTLYVGGLFNSVAPVIGGGAITDPATGVFRPYSPRVAGIIWVCIPDGRRGWFIGGNFAGVGGLPRSNLAHIFGDGHVDAWAPNPDGEIRSLALAGQTVYVGGIFKNIGGERRSNVAAVDIGSGRVTDWNPGTDDFVTSILVLRDRVHLGGSFGIVDGQPRPYLAAVDLGPGRVTGWDPQPDNIVFVLAAHGDMVFAGGSFYGIAGEARPRLAAFNSRTDSLLGWNANVDRIPDFHFDCGPCVIALLVSGERLYEGGGFNRIGGAVRPGLAALDINTGVAVEWDPNVEMPAPGNQPPTVNCITLRGSALYVGGFFYNLGGRLGEFGGALDTVTGERLAWDPKPNVFVYAMAGSGDAIFLGGAFTSVGPTIPRHGLAAFDLNTGRVTSWDPVRTVRWSL